MKRFLLSISLLLGMCFGLTINVHAEPQKHITLGGAADNRPFEGWGVSLCWWARMCGQWSDENIDRLVDWLVSPEGLNYRLFRYNIGGGDDPQNRNCKLHHMGKGKGLRAEMPGWKANRQADYDILADSAQLKIMLKIKQKRPDAIFEAFSNSAPWWMTESGCVGGNGKASADNLRPECYQEFADYLVEVCKLIKEHYGIEFLTLEPFNESLSDYWYQNGSQEGCHFDAASQAEFLRYLAPVLKESGLNTIIAASDETSTAMALEAFDAYGDALDLIGQWNVHTYSATNAEREQLSLKVRNKGLRLWMSETGNGGNGIEGNLNLLQRLFSDIKHLHPTAWFDWQYVEENGDQWMTVRANFQTEQMERIKNYYVRQQVTRFITPGSMFINTNDEQTLAAINGNSLVVAHINNSDTTEHFRLDASYYQSLIANKVDIYTTTETDNMRHEVQKIKPANHAPYGYEAQLPPHSVTTLVMKLRTIKW